jgi:hypothetical protein
VIPFLLLGSYRTGSTLVANSVVDHPEILFYGEVFHNVLHRREAEAARQTLGHGMRQRLPLGLPVCRNEDDGFAYLTRLFSLFERLDEQRTRIQPILETHPLLELEYRQLVGDFQPSMVRICSFLEVSSEREFIPRLAKLALKEPRFELSNYEELRERFRSTPFARFFP